MEKVSNCKILVQSPAKLNLFFRVLKKRGDGYHDIASLYVKVSLFDELSLELSPEDRFTCNQDFLCTPDNLVLKALKLFRNATNILDPISIHLEKKIPIAAGLGGGSSNAALTLLGLNTLFDSPLKRSQILSLAASIGSDVPFFIFDKSAYCTGRGEIIEEVDLDISYPLWIAKPEFGLSTPKVYQNCIPNEVSTLCPEQIMQQFNTNPQFINDLEPAAFRVLPALEGFKKDLEKLGFEKVCMTGSGSAFFCIGEQHQPPMLPNTLFFPVQII